MIARAWVASAAILPWLVLLPLHGVAAVLAQSATIVAGFHGAGLIVSRGARETRPGSLLAIQWGAAGLIAVSGLATALHIGNLEVHAALMFGCAAVHTAVLAIRNADYVTRSEKVLEAPRAWLAPSALLLAIGALIVLGAAADGFAQPFDDDGHLLAQLVRLLETGTLADPIGYPRDHQLGGHLALTAVAAGASEAYASRLVESLAFSLTVALAGSRTARRDASAALWRTLVVVAASALALAPIDPLPCWTAAGLVLALYVTVSDLDPAPPLPVALLAGAMTVLRFELLPIAVAGVWVVWWRDRRDHRRTAVVLAGVAAVTLPFVIARAAAWSQVPHVAHALVRAPGASQLGRALLGLAIAVPSAFVLQLIAPASRALRWAGIATACALGGVASGATGAGAYSLRFAWPIGLAFALLVITEIAREQTPNDEPFARGQSPRRNELRLGSGPDPNRSIPVRSGARIGIPLRGGFSLGGPAALITALIVCVLVYEGREAPGRLRWSRRMASAAASIDMIQLPPAEPADPYRALLASVPAGATVAVWVSEPERLDYARNRIVDLRTPAGARLRTFRWEAHRSQLESLLAVLPTSFLLIERDDARVRRTQTDLLYRFVCQTERPICADDLEAIAWRHPVVARRGNLQLVDLRR
jgi:hypothetical protein